MKILFADLDGTLLNADSEFSRYTREVFEKFIKSGNMVVPASGRPLLSVKKLLAAERMADYVRYIIAYNGALVYDCAENRPVWESGIDFETARIIQDECFKRGIHIQTYYDEHIITKTGDNEIDYYKKKIFLPVIYTDDPVGECKKPPYKMLAINLKDHDKLCKLKEDLNELIGERVESVFSNPYYLEFFSNRAGKGNGMLELCRFLNVSTDDAIAAGDEENDMSMIELAGLGVAMENSPVAVKSAADVVTKYSNAEDGLARFIASELGVRSKDYQVEIFHTLMQSGYDCVFLIDVNTLKCTFIHMSKRADVILGGLNTKQAVDYGEICYEFSRALVPEEKDVFIDQARIGVVLGEIEKNGCYVRCTHMERAMGHRSKDVRIKRLIGVPDKLLCAVTDISAVLDHDWMTDEFARSGFIERAVRLISEMPADEKYSLIYTNIKGFKAVNELFGSQSGDMVIFQARDALKRFLQPLVLGRLESDHFVMLVRDEYLTDGIIAILADQVYREGYKEFHFEIRLGIHHIDDHTLQVERMIDRAKLAEKSIRDEVHSTYAIFDEGIRKNYVKSRVLLSDMSEALDNNEFEPYFQPIVDVTTGKIASSEALMRWNHHDMGMVNPGDFVPILENNGRISALDRFMTARVVNFIKQRRNSGNNIVPVAINLSRIDFYDPSLMDELMEYFKVSPRLAEFVRVEVTESAYADLEKSAMGYLDALKNMGVKVLLDDFGSGMSSLSTLESFSFDIVKLDMGFVRKIGLSKKAEAIIESTVKLSHALGAKVIGEGVERENQLGFLKNIGCDYIQGFYYFKPMPEKDFIRILDEQ